MVYEYEDDEQEYYEKKKPERKWTERELFLLMRLRDLKKSSDMGQPDQGFPVAYKDLEGMGYAMVVGKGFNITAEGRVYLETNKRFIK